MVNETFLLVEFTKINLLHILILLGIPYLIFYIFERKTKFDKFMEKWEAGLFVFAFSGLITLISIKLSAWTKINFYVFYSVLLLYLIMVLATIKIKFYTKINQNKEEKWVLIKMKDDQKYKGVISNVNQYFLTLKKGKKEDLIKVKNNKDESLAPFSQISFNLQEIKGIYYL